MERRLVECIFHAADVATRQRLRVIFDLGEKFSIPVTVPDAFVADPELVVKHIRAQGPNVMTAVPMKRPNGTKALFMVTITFPHGDLYCRDHRIRNAVYWIPVNTPPSGFATDADVHLRMPCVIESVMIVDLCDDLALLQQDATMFSVWYSECRQPGWRYETIDADPMESQPRKSIRFYSCLQSAVSPEIFATGLLVGEHDGTSLRLIPGWESPRGTWAPFGYKPTVWFDQRDPHYAVVWHTTRKYPAPDNLTDYFIHFRLP